MTNTTLAEEIIAEFLKLRNHRDYEPDWFSPSEGEIFNYMIVFYAVWSWGNEDVSLRMRSDEAEDIDWNEIESACEHLFVLSNDCEDNPSSNEVVMLECCDDPM